MFGRIRFSDVHLGAPPTTNNLREILLNWDPNKKNPIPTFCGHPNGLSSLHISPSFVKKERKGRSIFCFCGQTDTHRQSQRLTIIDLQQREVEINRQTHKQTLLRTISPSLRGW